MPPTATMAKVKKPPNRWENLILAGILAAVAIAWAIFQKGGSAAPTVRSALTEFWSQRWADEGGEIARRASGKGGEMQIREMLSVSPRIEMVSDFLSAAEIAAFFALNANEGSGYVNDDGEGVMVKHWSAGEVDASPLLEAFERKVAFLTRTPHDDRSGLQCRAQTVTEAHPHNNNLHLDTHQAAHRRATVIAYLNDVDVDTGFTAFPCLLPAGAEYNPLRAPRERLCRAAAEAGATSFVIGQSRPRAQAMLELAQAVCNGTTPGIRIRPTAGTAVAFEYTDPRESSLTWHLGCDLEGKLEGEKGRVSTALQKYCIQKFKSVAVAERLGKHKSKSSSAIEAAVKATIKKHDKDRDGTLDLKELNTLTRMSGSTAKEVMAGSDIDGDGRLSLVEAAFRFESFATQESMWVQ